MEVEILWQNSLILYSNKSNKLRFVIHVNPILHSYQVDYRWCPFLQLIYYCYKASYKCISFQLCLFSITTHWCYSYLRICALPDFIVIESMLACQAFFIHSAPLCNNMNCYFNNFPFEVGLHILVKDL